MLKCKDIAERTSHYLEGDLPWTHKISWHLHLFMCGPCRRFIRQFKLSISASSTISQQNLDKVKANELADKIKNVCNHKPSSQ